MFESSNLQYGLGCCLFDIRNFEQGNSIWFEFAFAPACVVCLVCFLWLCVLDQIPLALSLSSGSTMQTTWAGSHTLHICARFSYTFCDVLKKDLCNFSFFFFLFVKGFGTSVGSFNFKFYIFLQPQNNQAAFPRHITRIFYDKKECWLLLLLLLLRIPFNSGMPHHALTKSIPQINIINFSP